MDKEWQRRWQIIARIRTKIIMIQSSSCTEECDFGACRELAIKFGPRGRQDDPKSDIKVGQEIANFSILDPQQQQRRRQ